MSDQESLRESFDGHQLRMARELRRLNQRELAEGTRDINTTAGVTSAAISQFERGDAIPTAETLALLVAVLEVSTEFLTHRIAHEEADVPAFFRSLRSAPARERKRARNLVQLVHRFAATLNEHVGLPTVDVPLVPCDPFDAERGRREAADDAAQEVRRAWELGNDPLQNVVREIEAHGVACIRLPFEEERVDAFSVPYSDRPIVVLSSDKDKWDRSRFDAAHELGHIVIHADVAGVVEAEKQANEFAAAFLMPESGSKDELPNRPDWRRLLVLKNRWGTSIAALLYRARTLKVMPERTYVNATKVMAARGWRRHEPLNRDPESPTLLNSALHKTMQEDVDVRDEAVIPADLFEELVSAISGDYSLPNGA